MRPARGYNVCPRANGVNCTEVIAGVRRPRCRNASFAFSDSSGILAESGKACVGRFAPSPSGPLHFGSLVAALGSALEAQRAGGRWLLRIEDIDAPRARAGADAAILAELERLGFRWDGAPVWQSRRMALYRAALAELAAQGRTFGCACSRKEIADSALAVDGARRYAGTCRGGIAPGRVARATRLRVDASWGEVRVGFDDRIQGRIEQDVEHEVGDFVLDRADGQIAYQLAVVVDDAEQGVTEVVRGADLLDSTPRQILLQRMLGLPTPRYAHLPVALDAHGEKLSKQTRALAIATHAPAQVLCAALEFLGQHPPADLKHESVERVWRWAHDNWRLARVPRVRGLPAPSTFA